MVYFLLGFLLADYAERNKDKIQEFFDRLFK